MDLTREPAISFTNNLDDDFALTRASVELQQHDLLPGAEPRCATGERYRHGWTEERRAHVARAVVVAPAEVVLIAGAARRQAIEQAIQVGDPTRILHFGIPVSAALPRVRGNDARGAGTAGRPVLNTETCPSGPNTRGHPAGNKVR